MRVYEIKLTHSLLEVRGEAGLQVAVEVRSMVGV